MAAAEIVGSVLYLAQQLGMTFGVGAETVLLGLTGRAYSDDTIRSIKKMMRLALWFIIVSGILTALAHLIAGDGTVFQPAYLLKWVLIFGVVILGSLKPAKESSQKIMAAFIGSMWYAMFILNIFTPSVDWVPLLIAYAAWTAIFVGTFMMLRLKQVPALSFKVALEQAVSSNSSLGEQAQRQVRAQDIKPKSAHQIRMQEITKPIAAPAPQPAVARVEIPSPVIAKPPIKIEPVPVPELKLQAKTPLQGFSAPKMFFQPPAPAHLAAAHPPELTLPPKLEPEQFTPPVQVAPFTPHEYPVVAEERLPEIAPNMLPQQEAQPVQIAEPKTEMPPMKAPPPVLAVGAEIPLTNQTPTPHVETTIPPAILTPAVPPETLITAKVPVTAAPTPIATVLPPQPAVPAMILMPQKRHFFRDFFKKKVPSQSQSIATQTPLPVPAALDTTPEVFGPTSKQALAATQTTSSLVPQAASLESKKIPEKITPESMRAVLESIPMSEVSATERLMRATMQPIPAPKPIAATQPPLVQTSPAPTAAVPQPLSTVASQTTRPSPAPSIPIKSSSPSQSPSPISQSIMPASSVSVAPEPSPKIATAPLRPRTPFFDPFSAPTKPMFKPAGMRAPIVNIAAALSASPAVPQAATIEPSQPPVMLKYGSEPASPEMAERTLPKQPEVQTVTLETMPAQPQISMPLAPTPVSAMPPQQTPIQQSPQYQPQPRPQATQTSQQPASTPPPAQPPIVQTPQSPIVEPQPFIYQGLSHVTVMPRSPQDLQK